MKILRMVPIYVLVLIMALGGATAVMAYNAASFHGEVVVIEPAKITTSNPFHLTLYPGGITNLNIEVENIGSDPITVRPSPVIDPDPGQELCVELPESVNIPGNSKVTVKADVFATTSVEPGTYSVVVNFER